MNASEDAQGAQHASSTAFALSPLTLGIVSLSTAVLLLAVFVFARRKSKARGDAVLLVGPCDAGKTAVLASLTYHQALPTYASLQTNSTVVALPESGRTVRMIDVPGHPRIRDQFKDYITDSKAVLFVVDASTISRNGPAAAEHLHHILHALTSMPPSQAVPSLLIVAHKIDLLKATASSASSTSSAQDLAMSRVRTVLERELEKRRASHVGGVEMGGLGAEEESGELGGLDCTSAAGSTFRFADWEGGEVGFVASSVAVHSEKSSQDAIDEKAGEHGLSGIIEWIEGLP